MAQGTKTGGRRFGVPPPPYKAVERTDLVGAFDVVSDSDGRRVARMLAVEGGMDTARRLAAGPEACAALTVLIKRCGEYHPRCGNGHGPDCPTCAEMAWAQNVADNGGRP